MVCFIRLLVQAFNNSYRCLVRLLRASYYLRIVSFDAGWKCLHSSAQEWPEKRVESRGPRDTWGTGSRSVPRAPKGSADLRPVRRTLVRWQRQPTQTYTRVVRQECLEGIITNRKGVLRTSLLHFSVHPDAVLITCYKNNYSRLERV